MGLWVATSEQPPELSFARELAIGVDLPRGVGDTPSDVDAVSCEQLSIDPDVARVSLHDTCEAAQERALPGAIGADKADNLTRFDVEVEGREGLLAAETPREAADMDGGGLTQVVRWTDGPELGQ